MKDFFKFLSKKSTELEDNDLLNDEQKKQMENVNKNTLLLKILLEHAATENKTQVNISETDMQKFKKHLEKVPLSQLDYMIFEVENILERNEEMKNDFKEINEPLLAMDENNPINELCQIMQARMNNHSNNMDWILRAIHQQKEKFEKEENVTIH